MQWPKLKPVDMMFHVIQKLSLPGSLVLDPCFGTRATVEACLLELKHRVSTGCEADCHFIAKMMPSLLQVFPEHGLDEE